MNNNTMLQINISVGDYQKLKSDLAVMIDLLQKSDLALPINGKELVEGLFYDTMKKGVMSRYNKYEVINPDIFEVID